MQLCGIQGIKQPDGTYWWPWASCWGIYADRFGKPGSLLKYRLTLPRKEGVV